MKKFLLLILPGGVLLTAIVGLLDLWNQLATGDDAADSLRWPLIYGLLTVLRPLTPAQWSDALEQGRALMLIAISENSIGQVGDTDPAKAPGGPSISPWQIERVNADACGYWTAPTDGTDVRAAYAAIPTLAPGGGIGLPTYVWARNAVDFFSTNVWNVAADIPSALEIWNGGPRGVSNSQAQAYSARGIAGAPSTWGLA